MQNSFSKFEMTIIENFKVLVFTFVVLKIIGCCLWNNIAQYIIWKIILICYKNKSDSFKVIYL